MPNSTKTAKSPLFTIFLVVFIDLLGFGIVIPILPYYAKTFGASGFELGLLLAIYSVMQFIFSPIWGRLSDHIGRRKVILISVFGTALAFFILGNAKSYFWLFFGRMFAGLASANISTASAYIADVTTPENRAKGMGLIGAGFGLGFIFGPAIGGVLSQYGYGMPMFFASLLALINYVFVYVSLKDVETPNIQEKGRLDFAGMRTLFLFGDARTKIATLLFFIVTVAFTQIEVSFAFFMLERFRLTARDAGWLLAAMGLVGAFVQGGLIGKLSGRFGEIRLVFIGSILMSIGLIGVGMAHTLQTVFITVALLGLGSALINPSLSSLASKGAPQNRRGTIMGIYQSAGSLARIVGPLIGGFAFDHFGLSSPFFASAAMYGIAIITLVYFTRNSNARSLMSFGLQSGAK